MSRARSAMQEKKEKNISLQNVLVATAACNFSTAELRKVLRNCSFAHFHFKMCFSPQRRAISTAHLQKDPTPSVLSIFTSKCAFHLLATGSPRLTAFQAHRQSSLLVARSFLPSPCAIFDLTDFCHLRRRLII